MNIFTMLSSSRGSKKINYWNKFSNYKSSVLHTELRVSTLVLFITFSSTYNYFNPNQNIYLGVNSKCESINHDSYFT